MARFHFVIASSCVDKVGHFLHQFTAYYNTTDQVQIHRDIESIEYETASLNMKVKIRKWNAVATWRWDIPDDDVCGICQVHFDGTCPTCKYPGDDCSLRVLPTIKDASMSTNSVLQFPANVGIISIW
jgi:hypothetical protein